MSSSPSRVVVRCPHCLSSKIRLLRLVAPRGYCFDASLLLVRCTDCDRNPRLSACTLTGEKAQRWLAHLLVTALLWGSLMGVLSHMLGNPKWTPALALAGGIVIGCAVMIDAV